MSGFPWARVLTSTQSHDALCQHHGLPADASVQSWVAETALSVLLGYGECGRRRWRAAVSGACPGVGSLEVAEVLDTLERHGDVATFPGGGVSAAPVMVIPIHESRQLVVGTAPAQVLAQRHGATVRAEGLVRVLCAGGEGLPRLDMARWTGLAWAPEVDQAWLEAWSSRLSGAVRVARLGDQLDEDTLAQAQRWQPGRGWVALGEVPVGQDVVIRRRQAWYGSLWWLARRVEGGGFCVMRVEEDEGLRLTFAQDRAAGCPQPWIKEESPEGVLWRPPRRLPRPEYRALLVSSLRVQSQAWPWCFVLPPPVAARLWETLTRTLGVEEKG